MDEKKRKPRKVESDEVRFDRLKRRAQGSAAEAAAADDAIDAMVKRSIERDGA